MAMPTRWHIDNLSEYTYPVDINRQDFGSYSLGCSGHQMCRASVSIEPGVKYRRVRAVRKWDFGLRYTGSGSERSL
jgi:hypothetical protein